MMHVDPNHRVADAMRNAAMRLEQAFAGRGTAPVYADDLAELLLGIAEELDPPLPSGTAVPQANPQEP